MKSIFRTFRNCFYVKLIENYTYVQICWIAIRDWRGNSYLFFIVHNSSNILEVTKYLRIVCTLWKNEKFTLTKIFFRQINSLVIYLVNALVSRNFCQKSVRVNFRNFHSVVRAQSGNCCYLPCGNFTNFPSWFYCEKS